MPSPLVPPPLNDPGALTWPRMLQRWLDDNPVTRLTRTSTYIQLPIFNQGVSTWNGYSDIVAAFNFEGPNGFSLQNIVPPTNPNYTCCIAYVVNSTVVTRYLLWDATGSMLPGSITPYVNQPIKKNFRLEVWNTSQGIASETAGVTIYTSKLGNFDYRYASDGNLITPDAISTNFQDGINASVITQLTVTNAGTNGANGVYNNFATNNGQIYYYNSIVINPIFPQSNPIIYFNGVNWVLSVPTIGEYTAAIFSPVTGPYVTFYGVSLPEPTVTASMTGAFNLPLTFPSGSYPTTN